VTLIAEEGLTAMKEEMGVAFPAPLSRRNVLVRGVPLNDLVNQTFRVGEVEMKGVRLAQPCKYLARVSDEPAVLPGLVNRGGLRASILTEGVIRVGDAVGEVESA
jgi:MOSC domain-containing protein YiiM